MNHNDQHQAPLAYPPPPNSQPPPVEGYPMKDGNGHPQQAPPPGKTKRRGDGFWKGCCAALIIAFIVERGSMLMEEPGSMNTRRTMLPFKHLAVTCRMAGVMMVDAVVGILLVLWGKGGGSSTSVGACLNFFGGLVIDLVCHFSEEVVAAIDCVFGGLGSRCHVMSCDFTDSLVRAGWNRSENSQLLSASSVQELQQHQQQWHNFVLGFHAYCDRSEDFLPEFLVIKSSFDFVLPVPKFGHGLVIAVLFVVKHVEGAGVAYPPPPNSQPLPVEGYPMKDGYGHPQQAPPPGKTKRRGDGFWKGCCAALCCCCVLDMCF
ncbi:hypothetical protein HHK36_023208 [Tetracentron sinense]|uniref:Cysteine-rich transmembrane domain-containing protein n=1 Tax=Tetracentron sinense TaxID=13715 RepID=A0A834YL38_TETSI|nr:hypothetical protein HHK36_023208 [Tetracentron sinense]